MTRKIIHIDMDCFYAAVECRENPQLKGKPLAVGGSPDGRGVVATCSYEAREFGVHSAMPMGMARRLCPDLIITPARHDLYRETSQQIRQIFHDYTDKIEPLSLDEAYLDVSQAEAFNGIATHIAQAIQQRIQQEQQLTASAGVAGNKFLAKVASDWRKPSGLFVIPPQDVSAFILDLPVKRIPGVGKVTQAKLERLGVQTCGQLQTWSMHRLENEFGKFGHSLYYLCRGVDDREVKTSSVRKSLSVEDTYAQDLPDLDACLRELPSLYKSFQHRLQLAQKKQRLIPKALYVKVRFDDFQTTTMQLTTQRIDPLLFNQLCTQAWERGKRPVRLLGLGVQLADPTQPEQLNLNFKTQ